MNNNLYYFNEYDLDGCDELKNKLFTYNRNYKKYSVITSKRSY